MCTLCICFVFPSYKKRYWKKPYFDAIDKLRVTLDRIYGEGKVSLVDATLRWMYNHSRMDGAYGGLFCYFITCDLCFFFLLYTKTLVRWITL